MWHAPVIPELGMIVSLRSFDGKKQGDILNLTADQVLTNLSPELVAG